MSSGVLTLDGSLTLTLYYADNNRLDLRLYAYATMRPSEVADSRVCPPKIVEISDPDITVSPEDEE